MYKIVFFVPEEHAETVKQAVFDAGGGRIGNYDCCCWQIRGEGQFRPLAGSNPHVGKTNQIEKVPEFRVELVCEENLIERCLDALKRAHPYEEPAYEVIQLLDF